jgi:hypothetical protein
MMALTPSTNAILKILEPMALPMLSPVLPSIAAKPDTNISGAEVPKHHLANQVRYDQLKILFYSFVSIISKKLLLH